MFSELLHCGIGQRDVFEHSLQLTSELTATFSLQIQEYHCDRHTIITEYTITRGRLLSTYGDSRPLHS